MSSKYCQSLTFVTPPYTRPSTSLNSSPLPPAISTLYKSVPKPLMTLNLSRPPTPANANTLRDLLTAREVTKIKYTAVPKSSMGSPSSVSSLISSAAEGLISETGVDAVVVHVRASERVALVALRGVLEDVERGVPRGKGMRSEEWNERYRGEREGEVEEEE